MDWKKIKPWIAKAAPWLGAALGGPFGAEAGALVAAALGTSDGSPEAVAQVLKAGQLTGEQYAKLREAELAYQEKMVAMGFTTLKELEEIAFKDRDSARNREIQTGDSWTPRVLAAVVILGWFWVQWFLLHAVVPEDNREIVIRGLGTLDLAVGMVLGYYFGTSASSRSKDQVIAATTGTKT